MININDPHPQTPTIKHCVESLDAVFEANINKVKSLLSSTSTIRSKARSFISGTYSKVDVYFITMAGAHGQEFIALPTVNLPIWLEEILRDIEEVNEI
jgi:hypothetical protein